LSNELQATEVRAFVPYESALRWLAECSEIGAKPHLLVSSQAAIYHLVRGYEQCSVPHPAPGKPNQNAFIERFNRSSRTIVPKS
jgi:hypothetical protein